MVVLGLELTVLVTMHVHSFVALSPVDELQHFDNLVRTSAPDLAPEPAEPIAQETLREVRCREKNKSAWMLAPESDSCRLSVYDPQDFAWEGRNASIGHVPAYYAVTGGVARIFRSIVPTWGLLTWARLVGVLWAMAGCYVTLRVAAVMDVRPWSATLPLGLILAVPSQLEASSSVNPDAALLLVGAGMLFAALRVDQERASVWSLLAVVAAGVLVDPAAVVAVLLVGAYLLLRSLQRSSVSRVRRPNVVAAISMLVVAGGALLAWATLYAVLATPADNSGSPQSELYAVDRLSLDQVLGSSAVLAMFPPTAQPNAPAPLQREPVQLLASLSTLLLAAALVGGSLRARVRGRLSMVAVAGSVALLSAGPLIILANYLRSGWYFSIPSRYGLGALPAVAVVLAGQMTTLGRAIVGATAGGLVVATTFAMW